jgi:FixJ family two-component response regulator
MVDFARSMGYLYQRIIPRRNAPAVSFGVYQQGDEQLVVIVDDDESVRGALEGLMNAVGFKARAFASAEEFLGSGEQRSIGCLIADLRMPGMSGLELHAALKAARRQIPTIIITAHADEKTRSEALEAGAAEFVAKPFDDEALVASVRAALAV